MKETRVLLLYSWDDDISQRRWHIISRSPRIQDINVNQTFALLDRGEAVTPEILSERIQRAVLEHKPDVLLMHTGTAFRRQPAVFLSAFGTLRTVFPALRLGFELRPGFEELCRGSGVFEDSPEMHEIEHLLFERIFGE